MSWLSEGSSLVIIAKCLLMTPGMMFIIGLIGESRILPISRKKQFASFWPGDLFLSTFVGGLLIISKAIPANGAWYQSKSWHMVVLVSSLAIGVGFFHFVIEKKAYRPRALNSPTKLYHDIVLYGLYSYVAVASGIANVVSGVIFINLRWLVLIPGAIWLSLVIRDSTASGINHKTTTAHIVDWQPLWKKNSP